MLCQVLEDLNYIAAMGPPGGGRNNVDPRFIALFNVYNLTPPTEEVRTSHMTPLIHTPTMGCHVAKALSALLMAHPASLLAQVLRHIYTSILTTRLTEFPESVKETAVRFTDATLTLFNTIIERLPPTPSKFHYIFNLRDLSRIYEGLCLATPDKVSKPAQLVRLWRNEGQRIFCDRLTTDVDMAMVNGEMEKIIRDKFADHADFAMVVRHTL
jgi:dynein heavy chain